MEEESSRKRWNKNTEDIFRRERERENNGIRYTQVNKPEFPNNRERNDPRTMDLQSWNLVRSSRGIESLCSSSPLVLSLSRGYGCIAMPLLIRFRLGKDLSTLPWLLEGGTLGVVVMRPAGRNLFPLSWLSRCARARCNVLTNAKLDA